MIEDHDGRPLVVSSARGLGVRLGEIPADDDGVVEPEAGGMSVAVTPRPEEARRARLFGACPSDATGGIRIGSS